MLETKATSQSSTMKMKMKNPTKASKACDSHESCNDCRERKCEYSRAEKSGNWKRRRSSSSSSCSSSSCKKRIEKNALDVSYSRMYEREYECASVLVSVCVCVYAWNVHLTEMHSMNRRPFLTTNKFFAHIENDTTTTAQTKPTHWNVDRLVGVGICVSVCIYDCSIW